MYLTDEGSEFVKYATQICENSDFVTERYAKKISKKLYIATQHYDFIADIFGNFLKSVKDENYRFSIREIETYNVIREVERAHSDIGIIAIKDGDFEVMKRYLGKKNLLFTSGRKEIIDLLRQRSRPYLFSNTLAPAVAAGSLKVLDIIEKDLSMREKLFNNTKLFAEKIKEIGLDVLDGGTPIIPVMLYDEHKAVEMAKCMMEKGVYVVAFSYPVVPKGKARIRTQLSAALSEEEILYIVDCFKQVKEEMKL